MKCPPSKCPHGSGSHLQCIHLNNTWPLRSPSQLLGKRSPPVGRGSQWSGLIRHRWCAISAAACPPPARTVVCHPWLPSTCVHPCMYAHIPQRRACAHSHACTLLSYPFIIFTTVWYTALLISLLFVWYFRLNPTPLDWATAPAPFIFILRQGLAKFPRLTLNLQSSCLIWGMCSYAWLHFSLSLLTPCLLSLDCKHLEGRDILLVLLCPGHLLNAI